MSSQYKRIIKIKDIVKQILIEEPRTRDDDRLLILKVWKAQNSNIMNMSFVNFGSLFLQKKFSDTESIRRSRQKIQEDHPHLKGKNAILRNEGEEEMKTFINTIHTCLNQEDL